MLLPLVPRDEQALRRKSDSVPPGTPSQPGDAASYGGKPAAGLTDGGGDEMRGEGRIRIYMERREEERRREGESQWGGGGAESDRAEVFEALLAGADGKDLEAGGRESSRGRGRGGRALGWSRTAAL